MSSTVGAVRSSLLEATGISFFFFQAEDGIRDRNVTGVQTCALPICLVRYCDAGHLPPIILSADGTMRKLPKEGGIALGVIEDRKSTRLNSSHVSISYAVFCLKKKM